MEPADLHVVFADCRAMPLGVTFQMSPNQGDPRHVVLKTRCNSSDTCERLIFSAQVIALNRGISLATGSCHCGLLRPGPKAPKR